MFDYFSDIVNREPNRPYSYWSHFENKAKPGWLGVETTPCTRARLYLIMWLYMHSPLHNTLKMSHNNN